MEVYNANICISGPELKELVSSVGTFKWLIGSKLKSVRRPSADCPALYKFADLPKKYQALAKQFFGEIETAVNTKPFMDRIVTSHEALAFFAGYELGNGTYLPIAVQNEYANNAAVLNAIDTVFSEQEGALKARGRKMRNSWKSAVEFVVESKKVFPNSLSVNEVVLKRQFIKYKNEGYEALISGKWCNSNRLKITSEIENWFLIEMASNRLSVNMTYIKYKSVANQFGWRTDISENAFEKLAAKPSFQHKVELMRHGKKGFRKLNGHTFKLDKPLYSNDIWVSDGTALNWYYRDGNEVKMATTYMVMDARSWKFIGWSTKAGINKENFEMQLEAYRMAIRNTSSKPYQLLYDNQGGHKNGTSKDFYNKLAEVSFATRAYRPSGKPIEQAFGKFQQVKLAEFPFWTGFSRESHSDLRFKPDMEGMKRNISNLPTYEDLMALLPIVIEEWNELDLDKGSPNKIYNEGLRPDAKPIGLDELAELFWLQQGPKKYYPQGIHLRINGEDKLYEVYDDAGNVDFEFRHKYLNQKFIIKYDPEQEYELIELYQEHATQGLQRVATAAPKRAVNRSVLYLKDGDKQWIANQMAAEDAYIDELEAEMVKIGFDEETKWTRWKDKLQAKKEVSQRDDDEQAWFNQI